MSDCSYEKEEVSQSAFSPGLVQNDEPIVYALVDPLTSSVRLFNKKQLQQSSLSVCRAHHITGSAAKSLTVDVLLEKDPTRKDEGFLWSECGEIREIMLGDSDTRAFCVIDDALENYEAHAHLGFSTPGDMKLRSHREAARANLLMLFNRRGIRTNWSGEPFLA